MKYAVAAIAFACIPALANPGLGLSVKPGMLVNAAHFGYNTGSLFAGAGLEFASISAESKSTYESPETTMTSSSKLGATVFLPQLAARLFLGGAGEGAEGGSMGGEVKPYVWLSAFYSLATASVTFNDEPDTTTARQLRDALSGNIGGTVAFGGEYYFAPGFSVGGEFGVRMLFGGMKTESNYGGEYSYISDNNLGLGFTYTAVGLNFYF